MLDALGWRRNDFAARKRLFVDAASRGLDPAALYLGIDTSALRAARGSRRLARSSDCRRSIDELLQARERIVAVTLEAAIALPLDDDNAVVADPLIGVRKQARLDGAGEAGGANVEAQVHGAGHLVDILAARALRANCRPFEVGRINGYRQEVLRRRPACAGTATQVKSSRAYLDLARAKLSPFWDAQREQAVLEVGFDPVGFQFAA